MSDMHVSPFPEKRIRLAFAPCADYTPENLRPALEHVLQPQIEAAGGVSGKSVMLKPNLLAWRKPDDPQAYLAETPWGGRIAAFIPGHKPECTQNPDLIADIAALIRWLKRK